MVRPLALLIVMACGSSTKTTSEDLPAPASRDDERVVRFEGAITDVNFGCWADNDCGIEVDKIWIWMPGGMRDDPPPQGKVIGFSIGGGGAAEEIKRSLLGKRVEVYAAKKPVWGPDGNVRSYDPKQLTLEGDAGYYVRAK